MYSWEGELPHFSKKELGCHHCGLIRLDINFASQLIVLRAAWGKGLNPASVCRCPEHNKDVGGHVRSLHMTTNPVHQVGGTCAIDVSWNRWFRGDKLKFASLAWSLGWSLGLNLTFIHLDARALMPGSRMPQKIFHYDNWNSSFRNQEIKEGEYHV